MTQVAVRTTDTRPPARARTRTRAPFSLLAFAGLALAALAESGSIGLLGLSGWFIASCAVAGATAFSTFSYIAPSGGVRSFAMLRIGSSYGERMLQHAAVLRRLAAIRLGFFEQAAERRADRSRPVRDGELLDQAMNDTQTESMSLITVISPFVTFLIVGAACLAIVAIASPTAAVVLGLVAAIAALLAAFRRPAATAADEEDLARRAARGELVTALDAWPELASLGATDRLVQRSSRLLVRFTNQQDAARRRGVLGATRTATLVAVGLAASAVASAVVDHRDPATVALVLMLGVGLFGMTSRLDSVFDSLALVRAARERRLRYVEGADADLSDALPSVTATLDEHGLVFSDYRLPANAIVARDRVLHGDIARGEALVVTGISGSGKTTFLKSLDAVLAAQGKVVPVAVDDHIFTGTVGSNLHLGDLEASGERITEVLAAFGLDRSGLVATTPVGVGGRQLSGGEQTRLRLARAILADPEVLIADEPTAGLDEQTALDTLRAIRIWLPNAVLVLALHGSGVDTLAALDGAEVIRFD